MTVLVGTNGSGKTTVLEAVHLMATARSFRTSNQRQLVREGQLGYQVKIKTQQGDGSLTEFQANGLTSGARRFHIDGAPLTSFRDLLGRLPVITLVPEDIVLIQGAEQQRRAFMDRILGTTDRNYYDALTAYRHILRQRNAALRQPGNRREDVELWNQPLADHADTIWRMRSVFVVQLAGIFIDIWSDYELSLQADLRYEAPEFARSPAFADQLVENYQVDVRQGRTSIGPHRDRLIVLLDGRPARSFGSMGEQKLLLSTLKLAEARYVHKRLGTAPVLLLDDLFATLDPERAKLLLGELAGEYQVVLTTTILEGSLEAAAELAGAAVIHCSREVLFQA